LAHLNPILTTADYRAATYAKAELGVKYGAGVDVIGNLPNMMSRMDILIYDSKEPSETMQKYMKEYCSLLYEVGVDIPYDIVDDIYFKKVEQKIEKCFFFSDDDYSNEMIDFTKDCDKQDMPILFGHYFFMKNEPKLAPFFSEIIDEEDYVNTIKQSKFLLTGSVQACLESLASGNSPVYFKRKINEHQEVLYLLDKYNIPIVKGDNIDELVKNFNSIILNYPKTIKVEKFNIDKIVKDIEITLKKYEMVIQ
jgi:hypothetical protein